MEDKKEVTLNKTADDETILGVVDAKELPDEIIKEVSGGCEPIGHSCQN